jgi:capsular polysaccharide biosynthesis protein
MELNTEVVERLARIEAGQQILSQSMFELQKAVAKLAVQEERQINFKSRLDAAWITIDRLKEQHDRCSIISLGKQVNWLWAFNTGLGVGLVLLFIKVIFGSTIP